MAKQKTTAAQVNFGSFGLNIKSASNSTASTPVAAGDTDFASVGAAVTFTVATACSAFVTVNTAVISTSDFEHRPEIFRDAVVVAASAYTAALGGVRVTPRSYSATVALSAGIHTLSAGVFLSSASGQTLPIGAANITAIVLGQVTA